MLSMGIKFKKLAMVSFLAGGFLLAASGAAYADQQSEQPSGSGTEQSPYLIANIHNLVWMKDNANSSSGKFYKMTADIDASETEGWNSGAGFIPIGDDTDPFEGHFDGDEHKITDLVINRPDTIYVGLFGYVHSTSSTTGHVHNLTLDGDEGAITGYGSVGGLAGYFDGGDVSYCYVTGTVTGAGDYYDNDSNFVGGLIGLTDGIEVSNCSATGAVTSSHGDYTGGLVGALYNSTMSDCYATGHVTCYDNAGGLVGLSSNSTISNCYATGEVTSYVYAGGLIGYGLEGDVSACYASGVVTGYAFIGGLVGYNYNYNTVENCYATGNVTGDEGSEYVGGLVGMNIGSTVSKCYSIGVVTGDYYFGGLIGDNSGTCSDSYWDMDTSGQSSSDGGTGKSTALMKSEYFTNWDWDNVWDRCTYGSYPYLRVFGDPMGSGTESDPYQISNLCHLVWMSDNVTSSTGKFYKMTADIDASPTADWNDPNTNEDVLEGFHPIGSEYTGYNFQGNFDGNGHTITGLVINQPDQYQYDGYNMGLFGFVGESGHVHDLGLVKGETGKVTGKVNVGGLVGCNEGTVSNCYATIEVVGLNVYRGEGCVGDSVGGLIGGNRGTVSNCYATGLVTGVLNVGGLIGSNYRDVNENYAGTVENCYATGNVTQPVELQCSSPLSFGGLIGSDYVVNGNCAANVSNCYATGNVTTKLCSYIGGLIGDESGGNVENCYATGTVTDEGYNGGGGMCVGGLIGQNQNSTVTKCHAGNCGGGVEVVAENGTNVGGLIGYNWWGCTVSECYATANVTGFAEVGGLIGTNHHWFGSSEKNNRHNNVTNCYAEGAVTGVCNDTVPCYLIGGLVGRNESLTDESEQWNQYSYVTNCYAKGAVTVEHSSNCSGSALNVGGLIGLSRRQVEVDINYYYDNIGGMVFGSYWDTETSGQGGSSGGEGKTTCQMKKKATFVDWNFTTIWNIVENITYPYLREIPPTPCTPCDSGVAPSGSGTENDPYLIAASCNLVWMCNNVNSSSGKYYLLTECIDASGTAYWNDTGTDTSILEGFKPIGNSDNPFEGHFDGNGKTISNLVINRADTDYVGLFGSVGHDGQVQNLGVVQSDITGDIEVGGLAGYLSGSLSNCYVTGDIEGYRNVGGLLGNNMYGTVSNCYSTAEVTNDNGYAGGLIGNSSGVVSSCYATGNIVESGFNVGGLIGGVNDGSVSSCYATGAVNGTSAVGGLVGYSDAGSITNSYAINGAVTNSGNCTGGLIGMIINGDVTNCYSTSLVTGTTNVGGLIGYAYDTVTSSYWDMDTSGQSTSAGDATGLTTAQMMQDSNFTGWNFTNIWGDGDGVTYHYLQNLPSVMVYPSLTVGPGSTAVLTATVRGASPLSYQWQKNGVNVNNGGHYSGSTTATLTITGADVSDAGQYVCIVAFGAYCSSSVSIPSNIETLTFSTTGILTNGTFEADTNGDPPTGWTTYIQSSKSGDWTLQTTCSPCGTILVPEGLQYQQTQIYDVDSYGGIKQVVTGLTSGAVYNITGSYKTNSTAATSSVRYDLSCDTDRANSTVLVSKTGTTWSTFSGAVTASGTSLIVFLDHLNGVTSNKASAFDNIVVTCEPVVAQQPESQALCMSSNVVLTVVATGQGTLAYQWQKDSVNLSDGGHYSGCTTATLSITNADTNDLANYRSVIVGDCGSVTSNEAALTLGAVTSITGQPSPETACPGTTVYFDVTATGEGTLAYQWQKNGTNLNDAGHYSGCTTANLEISSTNSNDEADYRCVVTGACGSLTSNEAALTLYAATIITDDPSARSVCYGYDTTFDIAATGEGTLTYQWQKDSANIYDGGHYSGCTTATLTIAGIDTNDVGNYRCVATGDCGSANSSQAALSIHEGSYLTNGTFEASTAGNPPANWTTYIQQNRSGNWTIGTVTPPEGSQWQQTQIYNTGGYGGIRQTFSGLTSGVIYTISGSYKTNSTFATASVRYNLSGSNNRSESTVLVSKNNTSWGTFSSTVTATGGTISLFLDHINGTASNKTSGFDNINVTCTP